MATRSQAESEARAAILKMADDWAKSPKTIHHAIKSYKTVIKSDPESEEANKAREAMLGIAKDWEEDGDLYSAHDLYKNLLLPEF